MIEDIIELLQALAILTPVQFLLILFGLAASVCLGFLIQARHSIFGLPMRALVTLAWGVSWVAIPNALVEWIVHKRTRLSYWRGM